MRVGLIHRDISGIPGGAELLSVSIMRCLKRSGFKTILLSGKKVDKTSFARHFGINMQIDQELVFPFWTRKAETYFSFLLPSLIKPFSDVVINAYNSDILPWVDVTYIHFPRKYFLDQKAQKSKFWGYYYKPYQMLEKTLSFRTSGKLFLANSRFTAELVRKQLGMTPVVIYPPVIVEKLMGSRSGTIRKDLIVTVSRFSSEKNLEQIPLIAKKVDANFVILGSIDDRGVYRRILGLIQEHGVEDRVKIIANAPLSAKIELLQKAKVYFHAMHSEHFGISIIEGMAAGCIPVVHDSGGPREFVSSKWRYIDLEDAILKIKEALHSWSPSIAEDMKAFAYRFREERFHNEFSAILKSYLSKKDQ